MKLLKIEWYKFSAYGVAKALLAIYAIMLIMAYAAVAKFNMNFNEQQLSGSTCFEAPAVWEWVVFISRFFTFMPMLIVILLNSNEYSFRTYRQHVIDGLNAHQLQTAKLYTIIVLSFCSTVLLAISGVILAFVYTDKAQLGSMMQQSEFLLYHFIKVFALLSMALMVSHLIKKSILAIVVLVFYFFVEMVTGWIFTLGLGWHTVASVLPFELFEGLAPNPARGLLQVAIDADTPAEMSFGVKALLALAYAALFQLISYRLVTKRNL